MIENNFENNIKYLFEAICYLEKIDNDEDMPKHIKIIINNTINNYIETLKIYVAYQDRHAWWVNGNSEFEKYCSNCCKSHLYQTDFCPNCGFKMDKIFANSKAKKLAEELFSYRRKRKLIKESKEGDGFGNG